MQKIEDSTDKLTSRLHMQVWQPGTERKACVRKPA